MGEGHDGEARGAEIKLPSASQSGANTNKHLIAPKRTRMRGPKVVNKASQTEFRILELKQKLVQIGSGFTDVEEGKARKGGGGACTCQKSSTTFPKSHTQPFMN